MLDYFKQISKEYGCSLENVISVALNRYGIIIENFDDNRIRFNLNMLTDNSKDVFFAVCVNTYKKSPFTLKGEVLYLNDDIIGKVSNIEKDTCTSTYFRNNKKAITFNSNSRSKCVGCKFCGTYSLTDEDNIDFSTKDNVKKYFGNLLEVNNIPSMKDIENITVCTGCFESEDSLFNHLLLINESFKDMDYEGSINYIGSQLRNYELIDTLHKEIGDFGIYLTVEKFLDRDKFMRPEKASLTLEKSKKLLEYCSSIGVTNTFLYILGLEDLDVIKKYFEYFSNSINKFPIVQVFQNYTSAQEIYRCNEGKDIKYYFEAKKIINDIFKNKELNPKLWECFRSLYFDDENKKLELKRCNLK